MDTSDWFSMDLELISLTPTTPRSAFSTSVVTPSSISLGVAP